jgi:hypothetical protein
VAPHIWRPTRVSRRLLQLDGSRLGRVYGGRDDGDLADPGLHVRAAKAPRARSYLRGGEVAMPRIEFSGVTKSYADGTQAVADLNLVVEDGEFLCLLGPSAAASRQPSAYWLDLRRYPRAWSRPTAPNANKDPYEENQEDCAVVPFVLRGIPRFSDDLRDFLWGAVFPLLLQNTATSQEPHTERPPLAQECSFSGVRHAG